MKHDPKIMKIASVGFTALLMAVLVLNILLPDRTFSPQENRILQQLPPVSLLQYMEGRMETKLDKYVNDQFPLRDQFIRLNTAADVTLGKCISNGVIRCRDHYLMETVSAPKNTVLRKTESSIARFRKQYPRLHMYFLLAPNAANILQDKLPMTVRVHDQNRDMDRFFREMKKIGVTPVDTRQTLRQASRKQQVFYRTDHHWTTQGAYAAYRYARKPLKLRSEVKYKPYIVKNDFTGTLYSKSGFTGGRYDNITLYLPSSKTKPSVISYADTKQKTTEFYQLNNLKKKDAYTVFGGSNHPLYTVKTPVRSRRRLLLIKDSYANSFLPFLTQDFREIVVVDPRYYFDNVKDLIRNEGVTDVLFLYNDNTFMTDESLSLML